MNGFHELFLYCFFSLSVLTPNTKCMIWHTYTTPMMIQGIHIPFRAIMKTSKPIKWVTVVSMLIFVFISIPFFSTKDFRCFLYSSVPMNQQWSSVSYE